MSLTLDSRSKSVGYTQPSNGVFLGFTRAFCSKSEWGSTQNLCIDDYTVME